ncbi:gp70 [Escherichia phage phiEB49]|uniref:Gp70 n=1 Tax=Escherichia phage phiEB49 TaxID=1048207 RepID=F8UBY0_9CAUD|nr:gp70 [Escherichia phage phiEB49]AEI91270.1 gp70 [Escherichia phage phiEB49]
MNNKVENQYEFTTISECVEFHKKFGNLTACDSDCLGLIIVNEGEDYE